MPRISIVNMKIGNTNSVKVALSTLGLDVHVANQAKDINDPDAIILPGVGNFRHAMSFLTENDYIEMLRKYVVERKTPFLGICLGMQLLAEYGEEGGLTKGLAWIPGRVIHFPEMVNFRIPHMGWDDINIINANPLFKNLSKKPSFYFVHSYYFRVNDDSVVSSLCDCGIKFSASVQRDNIFGVQFHPEKSQKNGMLVLENFCDYIKR